MAEDLARGDRMVRKPVSLEVEQQNASTPQRSTRTTNPMTPSWERNLSYGSKALRRDTMPPIPDHLMDGSWRNRMPDSQGSSTGQTTPEQSGQKGQLIAQLGEDNIFQDPVSQLFKVIVGGVIVGTVTTLKAANDLFQQAMKSTHDHGGGKNSQHGKSEDRPSDLKRLEELQQQLENAESKRDKVKIKERIKNLREDMARRRKGENHSRKPKK